MEMLEGAVNLHLRDEETVTREEFWSAGGHTSRRGKSTFLSELLVPKLVLGPQRLAQFPRYADGETEAQRGYALAQGYDQFIKEPGIEPRLLNPNSSVPKEFACLLQMNGNLEIHLIIHSVIPPTNQPPLLHRHDDTFPRDLLQPYFFG